MKCNAPGLILFRKEHPARPARSCFGSASWRVPRSCSPHQTPAGRHYSAWVNTPGKIGEREGSRTRDKLVSRNHAPSFLTRSVRMSLIAASGRPNAASCSLHN